MKKLLPLFLVFSVQSAKAAFLQAGVYENSHRVCVQNDETDREPGAMGCFPTVDELTVKLLAKGDARITVESIREGGHSCTFEGVVQRAGESTYRVDIERTVALQDNLPPADRESIANSLREARVELSIRQNKVTIKTKSHLEWYCGALADIDGTYLLRP